VKIYRKVEKVEEGKEVEEEKKVPGAVFLDKKISRNLVPGTPALPAPCFLTPD
jgi:hypothetical protein